MQLISLLPLTSILCISFPLTSSALPWSRRYRADEFIVLNDTSVRYEPNDDPKHRGTLHCFRRGTEATVAGVAGPKAINYICGPDSTSDSDSSNNNATSSFSYEPFANGNGSYPHEYIRTSKHFGLPYKPVYGKADVVWYDMHLKGPTHANREECEWVIKKITDTCMCGEIGWPSQSAAQSRGGWFQFEDDGTTFGIDPQNDEEGW
ncbi:MAG: hypothetical protein Q9169_007073 [Polycauliona sp. 2 TL-2023]